VFGIDGLTFGEDGDDGTLAGGAPEVAGALPRAWGAELDVCACACSMFAPTPRMIKHPVSNTAFRYAHLPSPFLRSVPSGMTLLHTMRVIASGCYHNARLRCRFLEVSDLDEIAVVNPRLDRQDAMRRVR
jgi:hypothetical protein